MNDSKWGVDVPLPLPVLKRHMTEQQISEFRHWKSLYKGHDFEFIQVLNVF
jgi:hypothetical protein